MKCRKCLMGRYINRRWGKESQFHTVALSSVQFLQHEPLVFPTIFSIELKEITGINSEQILKLCKKKSKNKTNLKDKKHPYNTPSNDNVLQLQRYFLFSKLPTRG